MTTYNIAIDYTTGNSFNSERIENETVGIVTTDITKAKQNLLRIKEHYKKYSDSPNFDERYQLSLLTDNDERQITPFWIGHFETLRGAKIVIEDDPDMAFEF